MMFVFNLITLKDLSDSITQPNKLITFIPLTVLLLLPLLLWPFIKKQSSCKVYLLDFACYKPPITQICSKELAVERTRLYGNVKEESVTFMNKMLERSGIGDSTYISEALKEEPPNVGMEGARREAEMVVFGAIDEVLEKTKLECDAIGILVVNCCIFNAVPSLCSMIINRYKLRESVATYNITGMGCSAGLLAIDLARQLLQVHRDTYVLIVSTENITQNYYLGNNQSKLLINCLFRVGGAAILLSNRSSDCKLSKYQLIHTVHTHKASCDLSYNSVFQEEDKDGIVGVNISKYLLAAAIKAIESNVTTLAPVLLPASEKIKFLINYLLRCLHVGKIKPYIPDFSKAVDHFFPHVGGKPVLDELQRNLGFNDAVMEAARMTLYRFGNTSSSSVWYELAYSEAKGKIKRGDRVWQIAFGSGFKCSSAIWRAIKTIDREEMNPWNDEIDEFPVDLRDVKAFPDYFKPSK